MYDCWMSLDSEYSVRWRMRSSTASSGSKKPCRPMTIGAMRSCVEGAARHDVTTGEHEATRWGFRLLLEMGCADILQPDVGWCGGITELHEDLRLWPMLAGVWSCRTDPACTAITSSSLVITAHSLNS